MTDDTPQMDPDVVGLLRELGAHDPEGFHGNRPESIQQALLNGGRVPRPASSLAREVERTLDETARHRACEVLRYVASELLLASKNSTGLVSLRSLRDPARRASAYRPAGDPILARAVVEEARLHEWLGEDNVTVCAFFAGTPDQGITSSVRLLDRALQLAPTDSLRNSYAMALLSAGHPRSALGILGTLLRRADGLGPRGLIQENMGLAYSTLGDHSRAASTYAALSQAAPGWRYTASSWLLNAIQAGDVQSAAEAARFIDDSPADAGEQVGVWAGIHRTSRLAGQWSVTPGASETLRSVEQHLGSLSRTIADAID